MYIYVYVLTYPYVSNPEPYRGGGGGVVLKVLANKISLVMGNLHYGGFGDRCLEQLPTISL